MKKIKNLLLFSVLLIFSNCESQTSKMGDFKLLPEPQEFSITGVSDLKYSDLKFYYALNNEALPENGPLLENILEAKDSKGAQIRFSIESNLDIRPEGYHLEISAHQILITAKDRAGLLYGFSTLEQLMEDAKDQNVALPICKIKDYPLLAFRAIHLDIKHHREKVSYYYDLMDRLKKYKINGIILEFEDKIKYAKHPLIGTQEALSISEWKKLSEYAHARNIQISPLVQGLGHASYILKHEKYKDLRDDPENDWAFNPLDPRTYELQFDLYHDAMKATPHGKYLHVGGDEVQTTGRGSDKTSLELQLIWLNKVCKFAADNNRIPIFWDDMPLRYAEVYSPMFKPEMTQAEVDKIWDENQHKLEEFLHLFPKNCIYMRWNYRASQSIGNTKAMEWFSEKGFQVMGATAGQTRWILMPQKESNMDNIKTFALSSIKHDLNGLLLTLWDDDSPHFELYMRGIIAFSAYSWSGDKNSKAAIKSAYRQREFSYKVANKEHAFIDQLEAPVAHWRNMLLDGFNRNKIRRSNQPSEDLLIELPNKENMGKWSEKYKDLLNEAQLNLMTCDSIDLKIKYMKSQAKRNNFTLEVYEQVNNLVRYSNALLISLKNYDEAKNKEQASLYLDKLKQLVEEFGSIRNELEKTYAKTRILTKSKDYILDQDHHNHLANQSRSFDWQFQVEILMLDKIKEELF
jgi:hexosaminidase